MNNIDNELIKNRRLLEYVGDLSQVCGIKDIVFNEGPEKGVRALYFRTGSGLNFFVLPDRGMDIGIADYKDSAISWISPTGEVNPAHYESDGDNWLRGFFGGLLTTCGFSNVGPPNNDEGEKLGLHGRATFIPAREVSHSTKYSGGNIVLSARGKIVETKVIFYKISMQREIKINAFTKTIKIRDEVINEGFDDVPLMLFYHVNFGYPIVSPESELLLKSEHSITMEGEKVDHSSFGEFKDPWAFT